MGYLARIYAEQDHTDSTKGRTDLMSETFSGRSETVSYSSQFSLHHNSHDVFLFVTDTGALPRGQSDLKVKLSLPLPAVRKLRHGITEDIA